MERTAAVSTNHLSSSSPNPYESEPLQLLVEKLELAEDRLNVEKKTVEAIQKAIAKRVSSALDAARKSLGKTEGVIHAVVEGCDVKSDIPKTVKWDKALLNTAAEKIAAIGENPMQFIEWEPSVQERKWEVLPTQLRELIAPARTMKHGKEKISVTITE